MQIEEKEYDQSFDWRIWKKLFPFMKPFRKYMIIALVFNTLCALVDIALPLFQQYAINHFISGNTTEGIGSFAGTYLVTIIFQTVSVVIFCRCAMVIEMNMAKNMKNDGTLTASVIVATTLLAAFTLTFWIFVLRRFGLI